jgi:hypothetical protein
MLKVSEKVSSLEVNNYDNNYNYIYYYYNILFIIINSY